MNTSTFFTIMAEFGTGQIPITKVGLKYFGYSEKIAKIKATKQQYPFPVFRTGGQKSTWVVDASKLAEYIDNMIEKGQKEWDAAR